MSVAAGRSDTTRTYASAATPECARNLRTASGSFPGSGELVPVDFLGIPLVCGLLLHELLDLRDLTRCTRHPFDPLLGDEVVVLDADTDVPILGHGGGYLLLELTVARAVGNDVEHVRAHVDPRLDRERVAGRDGAFRRHRYTGVVHIETDAVSEPVHVEE